MIKLFACLVAFLLFFSSVFPVLASQTYNFSKPAEGEIMEALQGTVPIRFLPGNPLYFLILAKEGVTRFFQPSAVERSKFDFAVSGKRLKETYLLLKKSDTRRVSSNLGRYARQNENVISQIEKARSQNQAVEPTVSAMADQLRFQEKLILAIYNLSGDKNNASFDENFSLALGSFRDLVSEIDKIQQGVKNRFEITKDEASGSGSVMPQPTPEAFPLEATPTYNPRRIIF